MLDLFWKGIIKFKYSNELQRSQSIIRRKEEKYVVSKLKSRAKIAAAIV